MLLAAGAWVGQGTGSESANSREVAVARPGRHGSLSQEPGLAEGLLSSAVGQDVWAYPCVLLSPQHLSNITDKAGGLPLLEEDLFHYKKTSAGFGRPLSTHPLGSSILSLGHLGSVPVWREQLDYSPPELSQGS